MEFQRDQGTSPILGTQQEVKKDETPIYCESDIPLIKTILDSHLLFTQLFFVDHRKVTKGRAYDAAVVANVLTAECDVA